ncbi:MAG: cation:proton antiporter [Actinobacteria bacterium]|nr:cation:proton antiporter [Actinomycetota bacterium]
METFELYLLLLGLLLVLGALLSGLANRSILSLAIVFLGAGMVLGSQGFGLINESASSPFVQRVTELTLLVILFVDGLEVERGVVRRGWRVPLRSLLIAMPLTAIVTAAAARFIIGLSWPQSLLLGALLSPTDPVLTSSVVTNRKIPSAIRNSLNLESGFNDGLALPAVLIFALALQIGGVGGAEHAWWRFLTFDLLIGATVGVAGAFLAVRLLRLFRGRLSLVPHYRSLYAFAVALLLYGISILLTGNGFITVYVAGIVFAGAVEGDTAVFARFSRDVGEVLKLATFVIFGSLLTFSLLLGDGASGILFAVFVLFAARAIALLPALAGTRLDWPQRLFMSWFGPKGVACIAYSLLVLSMDVPEGQRIFQLTALVVFGSIIFHSASDTPLANWFGSRTK